MQQLTKNKKTNKDRFLNVILGIVFMLSPFYGIALTIWAVGDIENYVEPYKFSFLFGGIGVILSYLISSKLKPIVLRVNKKVKDYSQLKLFFAMGFIGVFLLIGVKFNSLNATLQNTYKTQITNKTEREYRFMLAGYNKLHFVINNRPVEIRCHRKIWEKENIGESMNLDFYKSNIGFDYWKLNEK
jgi:hypothetical protein